MYRIILLLACFFSYVAISGQNNIIKDTTHISFAPVNVFVTDMKGKPSQGEQVFFKSEGSKKIISGLSDAAGKFTLQLPAGDKYAITIKSITDTAKYGMIVIPALEPDESFTEPFKVHVKFDLARTYTLNNVHFDFGKATLRTESFKQLEELVNYLKNKENVRVEVAGHTDNIGKDADNLTLSQQRAETIRNYVVKKGIAPARIIAKGYGNLQPVADNNSEEGRQQNRRTEVRIL